MSVFSASNFDRISTKVRSMGRDTLTMKHYLLLVPCSLFSPRKNSSLISGQQHVPTIYDVCTYVEKANLNFCLDFQVIRTEDNLSDVSIITFTPSVEDDVRYLTCRAENPSIESSALEDKWRLNVQCKCQYFKC